MKPLKETAAQRKAADHEAKLSIVFAMELLSSAVKAGRDRGLHIDMSISGATEKLKLQMYRFSKRGPNPFAASHHSDI